MAHDEELKEARRLLGSAQEVLTIAHTIAVTITVLIISLLTKKILGFYLCFALSK